MMQKTENFFLINCFSIVSNLNKFQKYEEFSAKFKTFKLFRFILFHETSILKHSFEINHSYLF